MTLDEAIKRAEEVAEEKEKLANAYESFKDYGNPKSSITSGHEKCLRCAKEHRQLAEWLKELKQLRGQARWIPVSERLPNHDEYIKNNGLFIVSDGNRSYSEWYDNLYDKRRFGEPTMSGFHVDRAVTAWMPLPEPYKAESEE